MEIYRHKSEGIVVFVGNCKLKTGLGIWVGGTMFKKMRLKGRPKGDDPWTGEASVDEQIYTVVTTRNWTGRVTRIGRVTEVPARAEAEGENRAVVAMGL